MRLWSLHPRYLDAKGLVALWREGLLAQKVLAGGTRGYRHHPQLERFREHPEPLPMIGSYLDAVWVESRERGYRFDRNRILNNEAVSAELTVTDGQMRHEVSHLLAKLKVRDPERAKNLRNITDPDPHPCLTVVDGDVEAWERVATID